MPINKILKILALNTSGCLGSRQPVRIDPLIKTIHIHFQQEVSSVP